jgi:hypothetical protein
MRKSLLFSGLFALVLALTSLIAGNSLWSDEPVEKPTADASQGAGQPDAASPAPKPSGEKPAVALAPDPPGMIRLQPDKDVWLDPKHKRVVFDGTVCLNQGQLEMFACTRGTKEHESIVTVNVPAQVIHAGLLKVGAKAGSPVQFRPKYISASGTKIDITCIWTDAKGEVHRDRAQDWVRDMKTKKALDQTWVFAGSSFWTDETTGEKFYQAEGGYLICVSNFPGAMLDLPVESSESNTAHMFEAFPDHVPPKGTRVRLVLSPEVEEAKGK